MEQATKPLQRLPELDALRGVAALLVLMFHYTLQRPEAAWGFKLGLTGVELFFIISGFVIFLTLKKTASWKQFVISRLARLYPAYWVCVTITALLRLLFHYTDNIDFVRHNYLANLTMFQYYFNIHDIDGPYWTLILEMLFYMTILFIFLIKKLSRIEWIGYGILLFILFYDLVMRKYATTIYAGIENWFPLINHFPLFFSGILFYKMKFEGKSGSVYVGILGCFLMTCFLYDYTGKNIYFISANEYYFIISCYFLLFLLYVHDRLSFIAIKPLLFFGKISYSLYLIHQYLSTDVVIPGLTEKYNMPYWIAALIAFLLSVSVAWLITVLIEQPVIRYFKARMKKKAAQNVKSVYLEP